MLMCGGSFVSALIPAMKRKKDKSCLFKNITSINYNNCYIITRMDRSSTETQLMTIVTLSLYTLIRNRQNGKTKL